MPFHNKFVGWIPRPALNAIRFIMLNKPNMLLAPTANTRKCYQPKKIMILRMTYYISNTNQSVGGKTKKLHVRIYE